MNRTAMFLLLLTCVPIQLFSQCHFNQAGAFSDSCYIAVRHSPELSPTSAITLEAWVYPTDLTDDATILQKSYNTSYHLLLRRSDPTAVIQLEIGPHQYLRGNIQIPVNVWSHIAATYDSATGWARICYNGTVDTMTQTLSGSIGTNEDSLFIGCGRGVGGYYGNFFQGYIDEVRIWNTSRSPAEIFETRYMPLAVWNAASGPYAGLVGAYRLNGNAVDEAGQGYQDGLERNMSYLDLSQKAVNYLDYNNSLIMYGEGYCIARRPASVDATTAITVEAWVKRDTSAGSQFQLIAGKTGPSGFDYMLYLYEPSNSVFFNINTNAVAVHTPTGSLGHTRWTHIAATYNSGSGLMMIYLNGDSVGSATASSPPLIGATVDSITIGNGTSTRSSYWFSGQIDEVRIWKNKVRTQAEIRASMFQGITWATTTTSILAATVWNFDGQNFDATGLPTNVPTQAMHFRGDARMTSAHFYNTGGHISPLLRDDEGGFYGNAYTVSRRQFEIPTGPGGLLVDSIYVPAAGSLSSVKAFVLLNHGAVYSLRPSLVHPGGATVSLFGGGAYGDWDLASIFTDDADSMAGSSASGGLRAPFSPIVKPLESLSLFNGLNPKGWWKLRMEVLGSGGAGVLYGWGVQADMSTGAADGNPQPMAYALGQNFPNPFNPKTVITCQVPVASNLRIVIYDMLGRELEVLVDEKREAGSHEVIWDATNVSTGVYLYRMTAGEFVESRKMLLLR